MKRFNNDNGIYGKKEGGYYITRYLDNFIQIIGGDSLVLNN